MSRPLTVGILGAGRIASGFDSPASPRILTLAHAVCVTHQLKLGGFFDTVTGRAVAAERKWGCAPSPRTRAAWLDAGWDVVFVATPDAAHPSDVREVINRKPRALLVEKPLALEGGEALQLMRMARRVGVPLLVDFPRREHSAIRRVARLLRSGQMGAVRRITGTYSGGGRHNGVHLLDVLAEWYSGVRSVVKICCRNGILHLELRGKRGIVPLILSDAVQSGCYVWELRVETERGRIDLAGAPEMLRVARTSRHPLFSRFTTLVNGTEWPMDEERLLARVVARVAALAKSSRAARAHANMEHARQMFFNQIFAHFPHAPEDSL